MDAALYTQKNNENNFYFWWFDCLLYTVLNDQQKMCKPFNKMNH